MTPQIVAHLIRFVLLATVVLITPTPTESTLTGLWPILLAAGTLILPWVASQFPNPLDDVDDGKILELTDPRILPFGLILILEIGAWGGALTGALVLRMAA